MGVVVSGATATPGPARADNDGDVVAGIDAALTGGAVVANVDTGAALWFNPAGVVRLDDRSIGLTGSIYSVSVLRAPGVLRLSSGEASQENQVAIGALPRAVTFVGAPARDLKVGLGLFYSRDQSAYLQDQVSSASATPAVQGSAVRQGALSLFHLSGSVGYRVRPHLLVGAALDLVVASSRSSQQLTAGYDGGAGGASTYALDSAYSGGGLQLKAGVQWQPLDHVRIGASFATPSYLVYLDRSSTETLTRAPGSGPPTTQTNVVSELSGTWSGVEAGSVRGGVAWLDSWGFLELDLVGWLPLSTRELAFERRGVADVRLGGVFQVRDRLQLGAGVFTDPSRARRPVAFGDAQIDHYGFTVGINFANREAPPAAGQGGFYLALALALRYSHGVGHIQGVTLPPTYDPTSAQLAPVRAVVDQVGANLAIKAMF